MLQQAKAEYARLEESLQAKESPGFDTAGGLPEQP